MTMGMPRVITSAMAERCTTHHNACDCREWQQAERIRENVRLREEASRLKAAWDRLCACVDEFEPDDMGACTELRDALDDAILKVVGVLTDAEVAS